MKQSLYLKWSDYLCTEVHVDDCNEVTDYAIARRIIDLHTKLEESVERTYTVEEITR